MNKIKKNSRLGLNVFKLASIAVLSILVLLSTGMVGALTYTAVASHDEYCNASKEEFFMEEYVWAKVTIYGWGDITNGITNGILWVCPCSWWGEKRMDEYLAVKKGWKTSVSPVVNGNIVGT